MPAGWLTATVVTTALVPVSTTATPLVIAT